jgi:hypothetical protein
MKLVGRYLLIAGQPMLRCYDLESKHDGFAAIAVYDSIATIFDCVPTENDSVVDRNACQFLCALIDPRADDEFATVWVIIQSHSLMTC